MRLLKKLRLALFSKETSFSKEATLCHAQQVALAMTVENRLRHDLLRKSRNDDKIYSLTMEMKI